MILEVSVRVTSLKQFGDLPGFEIESELDCGERFQTVYTAYLIIEEFDAFAIQQNLHCYWEGVNTPERTRFDCPGLDVQCAKLIGYGKGYEMDVFVLVYVEPTSVETVNFSKYVNEEANKRYTNKMDLIKQFMREFIEEHRKTQAKAQKILPPVEEENIE